MTPSKFRKAILRAMTDLASLDSHDPSESVEKNGSTDYITRTGAMNPKTFL